MTQRKLGGFGVFVALHLGVLGNASGEVVMDWVEVGDPGNLEHAVPHHDGTVGYGAVDYPFLMGEFEVTNAQYAEFLNAVAATDPNALYSGPMGSQLFGGILRSGPIGNYVYTLKPNMHDKPVNHVSWFDAARFVNWLHNGQPVGAQDASTTEDGAYTFTGFQVAGPRNPGALFYLPNEHEWQKAAFYEPGAVTDDGDEYWYYATGSDTPPIDAFADETGNVIDPGPNMIVHGMLANWNGSTVGNVTTVGSARNQTYYGARDMVGNVFEWVEADPTKPDPLEAGPYIVRGGSFQNIGHLFNTERNNGPQVDKDGNIIGGHVHNYANKAVGIRVAAPIIPIVTGDLDGDGVVGILDFLQLLGEWGPCPVPPAACPGDLDGDGDVGILDFLMLLGNWSA